MSDRSADAAGPIRAPADPVTEAVDTDALSDRAARRLAAIVESSDDAIVSKDLNGIVTSWNRAAERMFGFTAEEMIGQSIRTIIPAGRMSEEDDVLAAVRRGDKVDHFETIRQRKDGTLVPISLTVSPICDASGRIVGASKIARDISERRQAEAERARLLAVAEQNAQITEKLNDVGRLIASTFDRRAIVQGVTDTARDLTGAELCVFCATAGDGCEGGYTVHAASGAARDAFSKSAAGRGMAALGSGAAILRSDDLVTDPRYGSGALALLAPDYAGVRSYLAVAVKTRSGEVVGALFFGHSEPGRFTEQHERLASGIAAWASIALENARLYDTVEQASRLKDEFLATLSHELRTPLNAILGYARMLRSGIVPAESRQKAIETIERNATSLNQIVEDVLDVSRIVAGKLRLNVQRVDIADVVRHAVDAVAPAADAKEIKLTTNVNSAAMPIWADPERLQQVIWNLLSNAVKFTGRGGRIETSVDRDEHDVQIVVRDTGIGIAPEFLPFIFERFRQADAGTTREKGGLGLGLGIAQELVEMHGGTIEATSDGIGKGATFRVTLPIMATARAVETAKSTRRPRDVRVPGPRPNLEGVRVLAVDDDSDALAMMKEILEATGAQVETANSAAAALVALRRARPHVLVADLGMPHMDGFELIARVRTNGDAALRDLPAAALTAYARSEDRIKALRSGFQLHLAKPIDPAELMAAIASLAQGAVGADPA